MTNEELDRLAALIADELNRSAIARPAKAVTARSSSRRLKRSRGVQRRLAGCGGVCVMPLSTLNPAP